MELPFNTHLIASQCSIISLKITTFTHQTSQSRL